MLGNVFKLAFNLFNVFKLSFLIYKMGLKIASISSFYVASIDSHMKILKECILRFKERTIKTWRERNPFKKGEKTEKREKH